MALSREGISIGNNYVNQINTSAKELALISQDIINYLNSNSNFQIFREGTEKGEAIYNDLKICVTTIVERLAPTIEKISSTSSNLLSEQQNLNRADRQYN